MENLTEADRYRFMEFVNSSQVKAQIKTFHGVVERCFMDCANDFTSRSLMVKEETCVNNCIEKFLKFSQRAGQRYAEQQETVAEKMKLINPQQA